MMEMPRNHFHDDIFNFCDSPAIAGEHHAIFQKLISVQENSRSEKSHKLSGKHATGSNFSEFVGKLWQLTSLLKAHSHKICSGNFLGQQYGFSTDLLFIIAGKYRQWSLWMLPRLVFGKLNSIHGILYLYKMQNIAFARLFVSFS